MWADEAVESRLVERTARFCEQHLDAAARDFGCRAIHNFEFGCNEQKARIRL